MSALSDRELRGYLEASYHEATRKLIDFTQQIRTDQNDLSGKTSVKLRDLRNLFDTSLWEDRPAKSGHRILKNRITHIRVEYGNHKNDVEPGDAEDVYNQVQEHLNILNNIIFAYSAHNWKVPPDYTRAIVNYHVWEASRRG